VVDDLARACFDHVARAPDIEIAPVPADLEPAVVRRRMLELDVRGQPWACGRQPPYVEDVDVPVRRVDQVEAALVGGQRNPVIGRALEGFRVEGEAGNRNGVEHLAGLDVADLETEETS